MVQGSSSTLEKHISRKEGSTPKPIAPDSIGHALEKSIADIKAGTPLDADDLKKSVAFLKKSYAYTTEVNNFISQEFGASDELTQAHYKKLSSQALDYICHHIQLTIGTNKKITASLMYLNRDTPPDASSLSYAGMAFEGKKALGILEIDAFNNSHAWNIPYIEIPYFEGSEQVLGAPASLATGEIQIIADTMASNLSISDALRAYFDSNSSLLRTFVSIPIYSSEGKPLGVLNINADEENFFALHRELVQSIVEPWRQYLAFLLSNRPSSMEKNDCVNHDEHHENYMSYIEGNHPFFERLKKLGKASVYTVLPAEIEAYRLLKQLLKTFSDIAPSEVLEEPPSPLACELAEQILGHLERYGCVPDLLSPSPDGGVLFEFAFENAYVLLEVYNSGELVYFKRPSDGQIREAFDCDMAQLQAKIEADLLPLCREKSSLKGN